MKLLCVTCDEQMTSVGAADSPDSLTVTFRCPHCERRVALLINSRESQLVRSLGLAVGGGLAPAEPPERVPAMPEGDTPVWTEEAERRLQRVPGFVRDAARESIERYVREHGHREVTIEIMNEARERLGM